MVDEGEACDDGNYDDADGCPSGDVGRCSAEATCGDGILWDGVEVCDDGNAVESDGCPSGAQGRCLAAAACGDGLIWTGVEACDDGNGQDSDECPSGVGACSASAVCGDGFIWEGQEDCEDGNLEDHDGCSNACAAPRWVFISSATMTGAFGGVAGADAACQSYADAAGLAGTYRAWLSEDAMSAPVFRFGSEGYRGWYLLPTAPPTPVAQGWSDLTSENEDNSGDYLRSAINADEYGAIVGETAAWTNTAPDGHEHAWTIDCEDWSVIPLETGGSFGLSRSDVLTAAWSFISANECDTPRRLYCFQTE
ncbi:MAG: DUF4215 domain-containing protein [Myxococcales bacterium]|nr:DUF4215 domain-containing protein [Myxococcales bacterium]